MADIFLKIVNMSISAGWIVLAVLILRLLLKKAPKWINCILWGIVGLRLVMPFSLESVFSLIPSTETISKAPDSPRPYFESGLPIVDNQVNDYLKGNYFEGVSRPMGNFIDVTTILGIVWTVGIIAFLAYTVISYVRLRKKIGTAVLLRDNIFQSENVVSPFVLGIIKPKIYLPFNMNDSDMQYVIAHEQAHIKRKDHLWKPLGFLLLTVYWFNPLIWLGYVLLCRDIELACDERVVKELNGEQRADYSEALLSCSVNRRMIAACPLAFGEVGVKNRIKTVLNYKKPAFWIIIIAVIASVIVGVCFLTNPTSSKTLSKLKIPEAPNLFDNVTEIQVTIPQEYFDEYYVNDYHFILDFLEDIEVSKKEISKSRSEDRAKEYNVILKYGDSYEIIHFDKECKVFWINNGVKPSFSYQVVDNKSVKAFFEKLRNQSNSDKITWSYRPMLSFTGYYAKAFFFDFDYTHVEATCTNGEMWNLEVEGQPRDTTMRFEKGKNVYWTPSDAIDKIPQKSEVTLKVYNNKTQLNKCTVIFECVSRDLSSAEFEIYLKDSDGLEMMYYDGRIMFVEQSSISNVGGVDAINDTNPYLPELHVSYGNLKVRAWTGTASWTFTNDNGMAQAINADSSHPLEHVDNIKPWGINIADRDEVPPVVELKFDIIPDSIKVNAWFFTESGKTKAFDADVDGFKINLINMGETCLYEVVAEWNSSDKYSGKIHYAFCTAAYLIEGTSIKEITDRTVTEGIPTDDAEQPFFVDENYIYSYPTIRSEYVIVKFNNGDEMTVQKALSEGYITISTLDEWDIEYIKKENDGSIVLAEDGTIQWISQLFNSDISVQPLEKGSDIEDISISYKNLVLDADKPYIEVEWKNNTKNRYVYGKSFELEYLENGKFKNCAKEKVSFKSIGVILPAETTKTERYNLSQFNLSNEGTYRFKVRRYENNYLWFDFKISKK